MFTRGYIPVTGVSTHGGTPKSSISRLIFHEINHPALGYPHDHGKPPYGGGSKPIIINSNGMNIHLPAILGFH